MMYDGYSEQLRSSESIRKILVKKIASAFCIRLTISHLKEPTANNDNSCKANDDDSEPNV